MKYLLLLTLALASCGDKGESGKDEKDTPPQGYKHKDPPQGKETTTKDEKDDPKPAAPPYSLTNSQSLPSWNDTAYNGVKVTGTLVASNQGAFDTSKIAITANCGGKTGTNRSVASAAFSEVLIEISGLTPADLVSCTVVVTYDGKDMDTGEVAYDKVVELGKAYPAGDLTGTSCTNIRGLLITPESRFHMLRYSAADYSNATYLVNTAAYDGGCIIGGKHVVGNARKQWSDGSATMCWGATNDSTGNFHTACHRADIDSSVSVWFLDSGERLWKDSRT